VNSPHPMARSRWFGLVAALTIFVSAFLLFQVQPIESKLLLPWFGGSAAVWNTCVVFFQIALLGGYCYSHFVSGQTARTQAMIHVVVVITAVIISTFTIVPHSSWKPTGTESASMRILLVLLVNVGLPFFLLSTTGPLVQAWFARFYPARSPYRLYALSNIGSLIALASYPFVFERMFDVPTQALIWKGGFILFGLMVGVLAVTMANTFGDQKSADDPPALPAPVVSAPVPEEEPPPKPGKGNKRKGKRNKSEPVPHRSEDEVGIFTLLAWLGLPLIASIASLAVTGHLTEDVPTVPFMLIVPFTIYLLSFIICFDAERWYVRWFFLTGVVVMVLWIGVVEQAKSWDSEMKEAGSDIKPSTYIDAVINYPMKWAFAVPHRLFDRTQLDAKGNPIKDFEGEIVKEPPGWLRFIKPHEFKSTTIDYDPLYQSAFYLLFLFFACMVCHGEVAALKPVAKHVTGYYLVISIGGALGGMFVALLCPVAFDYKIELPVAIMGSIAVACLAAAHALVGQLETSARARAIVTMVGMNFLGVCLALVIARYFKASSTYMIAAVAFGVIWGTAIGIIIVTNTSETVLKIVGFLSVCGISAGLFGSSLGKVAGFKNERELDRVRGFFGVLEVRKYGEDRSLVHGRIQHGYQHAPTTSSSEPDLSKMPTTYYASNCGIGLAIRHHPNADNMRVAVVGLGAGTTAAFANKGETYHFYEIDPVMLAFSNKHFTYRSDAQARGAEVEVKLGDARLTMERIEPQNYDVIAVDAFSGDSIPVHLLTEECMTNAYLKHLKPDGILAVHISNRYLDLEPVVRNLAIKNGMQVRSVKYDYPEEESSWLPGDDESNITGPNDVILTLPPRMLKENSSEWILVTKNEAFLNKQFTLVGHDVNGFPKREILCDEASSERRWKAKVDDEHMHPVAWTDRYSPLWDILSFPQ
jgi:SAM-dependent methyltransferase